MNKAESSALDWFDFIDQSSIHSLIRLAHQLGKIELTMMTNNYSITQLHDDDKREIQYNGIYCSVQGYVVTSTAQPVGKHACQQFKGTLVQFTVRGNYSINVNQSE